MSVLVVGTESSLSSTYDVLPQYSQNDLHELNSVFPNFKSVEEYDLAYNSTAYKFSIDRSHASYIIEEDNIDYNEIDYIEETSIKSFTKSSIKFRAKIKKIEKMRITL